MSVEDEVTVLEFQNTGEITVGMYLSATIRTNESVRTVILETLCKPKRLEAKVKWRVEGTYWVIGYYLLFNGIIIGVNALSFPVKVSDGHFTLDFTNSWVDGISTHKEERYDETTRHKRAAR